MIDPDDVRTALGRVHERIVDAGGDPAQISVLAVTKGFGADAVRAVRAAGLDAVGENYAQELLAKAEEVADPGLAWHMIGRLQTNMVRALAPVVACWQSLDRTPAVDGVARRAPGAAVVVQVAATGEPHKGGAPLDQVPDLVARGRDAGLDVRGLMAVGAAGDPARTAVAFTAVVDLADRLELPERSLGMSDDLAEAVRAGTTMVRLGTALLGPRRSAQRPPDTDTDTELGTGSRPRPPGPEVRD